MKQEINVNGKRIIIVGTAHISQDSVEEVENEIREIQPDTVCVELCSTRFEALQQENRWKNMDIVKVIKEGKAPLLMANLVLSAFQRKIGNKIGVKPGAEMMKAVKIAEELDAEIELVDREVSTTLKRAWRKLNFWEKANLLTQVFAGSFQSPNISKEEIEKMKDEDVLSSLLEELSKELPKIKEVLIDERDCYLAAKIREAPGETIIAVVGAGHVPGIVRNFEEPIDISELEKIPKAGKGGKFFKWGVPSLIIGIFIYGFTKIDASVGTEMIKIWILANGTLAAIGAIIAGGHIITVISAFIAAPITSLNPTIGAGMVSGLTEAWVRKPRVSDFENLSQDITSVKGFWKNEITRILLVVMLSNLGSMLGTFFGVPMIAALL